MKNKLHIVIIILTILLVVGFSLYSSNNKTLTLSASDTSKRTEYQNAVVETAYQYYYRGKALQYDAINMTYGAGGAISSDHLNVNKYHVTDRYKITAANPQGMYSPEEVTDQDYHFFVCSHFTFGVYSETFVHKNGEKYQFTSKDGKVIVYTAELNAVANKDKTSKYRKDITVLSIRDTDTYKIREHPVTVKKEITEAIKPGDLFVYGNGNNASGHVMLYVGNDTILHSSGGTPSVYSKAASKINNYGVASFKYHLESKADMIDTTSGTYEVSSDTTGTIKESKFSEKLDKYIRKTSENNVLTILRPINEIVDNDDIELSSNSKNRAKKPKLSLTKKASVEMYQSVNLGSTIKYTITIENKSNNKYENISVYEEVPKYTTLESLSDDCKNNSGKITCSINVEANKKATIQYTVRVVRNMNYLGKVVESNKGKVNNIPLKSISTKINKTLTSNERTALVSSAKGEIEKTYSNTESFINEVYKKLNYNVNIISASKVFSNLFNNSTFTIEDESSFFAQRTLHKKGDKLKTFELKKLENVDNEYKPYMKMYVEGLFGGVATTSQNENQSEKQKNIHYRNVTFTTKSLMVGDVLYIYDANYENDDLDKYNSKGGYIVGKQNAYLYLGNGEFATVKNNKVYIYDKDKAFNYYVYKPDRSMVVFIDLSTCPNCKKVSRGERLLTSLIGQDSFIVLRPSYGISEKLTKIEVTTMPTKTDYIQNSETISLKGGKLKLTYGSYGTKVINLDSSGVTVTNFDNSKIGKTTATINYQGQKTTITVNIVAKSLTSISIKAKPSKLDYVQNSENLDLTGGVILAKYNDGSTSEIEMTSSSISASGFNNSKIGTVKITIDYLEKKATFNVNIVSKSVSSISLTKKPSKLEYLEGKETLDLTGGIIRVKYNDGSTKDIDLPNNDVTASGFDNKKVGENKVTLTYKNKTATFKVTINSKQASSIEMNELPSKLDYIQNKETLDISTGSILVKYNNGTSEKINLNSPNVTIRGFNNNNAGKNKVTVQYLSFSTSFEVNIISESKREITGIEISKLPKKTNYTQNKEKLDLAGGKIIVKYSDATKETISMTSSNVKAGGFDNSVVGKNTITISYLGKTAKFDVTIKKRSVKKVKVVKEPTKKEYSEEEKLDVSGGSVEVTYSDDTKEQLDIDSPNITVSALSVNEGEDTIVVESGGKKDSFKVTVSKILGIFEEIGEDDDFDVDYSEYGEFYDAVKMKPSEVGVAVAMIFAISVILYLLMRKVK